MNYERVGERVREVRERIAAAQQRGGREGESVTLVAVTKTHPAAAVLAAKEAGLADVGENRVAELEEKVAEVGRETVHWHLIGNLQRKKVSRALPLFDLIHSLDSLRLAQKLSEEAVATGAEVRALVQVNASGEESKSGLAAAEAISVLGEICALPGLRVQGLMTMAPFTADEAVLRGTFAATRRLWEDAAGQVSGFEPVHLSMGMSNDYELAVEEGSNLVRLGTVLFGERET